MTATALLFRDDAYATSCEAPVVGTTPEGGVILDRTVFYAQGGGQPGDVGPSCGPMATGSRSPTPSMARTARRSRIWSGRRMPPVWRRATPSPLQLDWARRLRRMRVHTALHLLSVVLPYPVTGGSIGDGDGRLDFDIPDAGLDKAEITDKLNALIARDAAVTERWITDEELDANPGLVKTMSVKPPRGSGRVRLVEIEGIDLQPCGGTHVRRTGEIGTVAITDIEKKGKQNRRVRMSLAD